VCGTVSEQCNSTTPLGCTLSTCTCDTSAGYYNPGPYLGCLPVCGDDRIVAGEQCETGYLGCNSTCQCATGFFPASPATKPCNHTCGDNLLALPVEQCEPSLSLSGSCNSQCLCDNLRGYYNLTTGTCSPVCGDAIVAPNSSEQCEFSIGCNNTACTCDNTMGYYYNSSVGPGCNPACGDGILVAGPELCEPSLSPVACTDQCECATALGYSYRGTCLPTCGDRIVSPGSSEQCDSTLGCDNSSCLCISSSGYWHNATTNTCEPQCGDSIVAVGAGEQCELGGFGCLNTCRCALSFSSSGSISCLSAAGCSPPWPGPGTICVGGSWTVQSGTVFLPYLNVTGSQFVVPANTSVIVVGSITVNPGSVIVISTGSSLAVNSTIRASNFTIAPDGTIISTSGSIIFTQATITPSTGSSTSAIFNSTTGCIDASSLVFNFGSDTTILQKTLLVAYQGAPGCAPLNPVVNVADSGRCEKYKYSSVSSNQGSYSLLFSLDTSACPTPSTGGVGGTDPITSNSFPIGAAVGGAAAALAAIAAAIGGAIYYLRYRRLKAERNATKKKLLGAPDGSRSPSSSVGAPNAVQMQRMK
jgi:hypothetical protein